MHTRAQLEPLSFTGITQKKFASIQETAVNKTGLAIKGNSGEASKLGIDIAWNYDGKSVLTFDIKHVPFIVSKQTVIDTIAKLVQGDGQ